MRNRLIVIGICSLMIMFGIAATQLETGDALAAELDGNFSAVELALADNECGPNRVYQQNEDGTVTIEAEHFTRNSGAVDGNAWLLDLNHPDSAGGGQAMSVLPNDGDTTFLEIAGPSLEYDVNFDAAGSYYVFIRGVADEFPRRHVNDSLHFGLNGVSVTNETNLGFTGFRPGDFNWKDRSNDWEPTIIEVTEPGLNTLNLWMREDGLTVDRIHLSPTGDFDVRSPEIGPDESACVPNNPPSDGALAWDMVNSTSEGLISFTTDAPEFLSPADCFAKKQRGVSATIPFGALDDSLTIFPDDEQGIIGEANTGEFFCMVDTINDQNDGVLSAEWQFDIADATDLSLSIDIGAMGNFETTDTFELAYSIDGGAPVSWIVSSVVLSDTNTYVLDDGDAFTLEDPMFANAVLLDNSLQSFSQSIEETGTVLSLVLSATISADDDAVVFQNLMIDGTRSDGPAPTPGELLITEIMYNPASIEPTWEWIEVYNNGGTAIDLSGYVVDDGNAEAHSAANIAAGMLPPGQSGILYNADLLFPENFTDAWGDVNLIAVTNWGFLELNNTGDSLAIWDSFAAYEGNHETLAGAITAVTFDDSGEWPTDDGFSSIYLNDLSADPNLGSSWSLSAVGVETPVNTGYQSMVAGGNGGLDIGSPGDVPPIISLLISEIMYNPASTEPAWEWVEIYNAGNTVINTEGFVIDDGNTVMQDVANVGAVSLSPGESAVLYNADALLESDFQTAWGTEIILIPVTNWVDMSLDNGGDVVTIWDNIEIYQADMAAGTTESAMASVTYDDGDSWPEDSGFASIYLTDLEADSSDGANWALSVDGEASPVGTAQTSNFGGGNSGLDIASP